jgi:hypothetical protein
MDRSLQEMRRMMTAFLEEMTVEQVGREQYELSHSKSIAIKNFVSILEDYISKLIRLSNENR